MKNTTTPLVQLDRVSAGIGPTELLHDINWRVLPGQHWVITGAMSAGKSLLARCLAGRLRIMAGRLRYPFLGEYSNYEARRRAVHLASFSDTSKLFRGPNAVHYYQQRYNAFDADGHLTVRQYLRSGGFLESEPAHRGVVQQIGIDHLLDLERIKLSSGQTRKMLIAKALLGDPRVLILDNPYIGLDAGARRVFNEQIDRLAREENKTIILAGQYRELPRCITHRLHLEAGRIKAIGKIDEASAGLSPQKPGVDKETLAEIKAYYQQHRPGQTVAHILRLENVRVGYGENLILEDLNWRVAPGEKWALFGPNGSGKSTLLSLLYGDHPQAYANRIYLFDRKRGSGESIWDIKKRIGFTSSELHAYFDYQFTAGEVVLSGLWDGFVRRRPTKQQADFARLLFRFFAMESALDVPFTQLSTGRQRLLFLLRALVKCPELLLLDEPFQGFDRQTIEQSRHLLSEILTDRHSLIFITHYQQEIPEIVDKVFRLK